MTTEETLDKIEELTKSISTDYMIVLTSDQKIYRLLNSYTFSYGAAKQLILDIEDIWEKDRNKEDWQIE